MSTSADTTGRVGWRQVVFHLLSGVLIAAVVLPHGLSGNVSMRFELAGLPLHPVDLLFALLGLSALPLLWSGRKRLSSAPLKWPFLASILVVAVSTAVGILGGNRLWDVFRDLLPASFLLMAPVTYLVARSPQETAVLLRRLVLGSLLLGIFTVAMALAPASLQLKQDLLEYWQGTNRVYFHGQFVFPLVGPILVLHSLDARTPKDRGVRAALLGLVLGASFLTLTRNLIGSTLLSTMGGAALFLHERSAEFTDGSSLRGRIGAWRRAASSTAPSLLVVLATAGAMAGGLSLLPSLGARVAREWRPEVATTAARSSSADRHPDAQRDPAAAMMLRLQTLRDPGRHDASFRGRQVIYQDAIDQAARRPWLGSGLGSLFEIPWAHAERRPVRTPGHQPTVDSVPLTLVVKSGLLGLGVALWFAGALIRVQFGAWRRLEGRLRIGAGGLLLGTLALLLGSLLHTVLLSSRFVVVFGVVVGLSARLDRVGRR